MSENEHNTTGWDREQVRREAEKSRSGAQHAQGQRPPQRRRKKKRGNPILGFLIYIVFVVVSSALLAGVGWLLANDLCALNKEMAEATIEVTKEDNVNSVATKLKEAGLIEYKWFFKLFAWVSSADEKIGEGTYTLTTDMDYRALIVGMMSKTGQNLTAETVKVTIPEGYSVAQIIRLLAEKGVNTEEALTEAAQSHKYTEYEFVDNENLGNISRLEGYLYPDTYEFYVGEKASNALGRLLKNFSLKMDEEMLELIENSGHSMKEILTIASLIERETDGGDRSTIASVIYNRINNPGYETGGLLQIDAALVYATGHNELTEEDKAVDSPYNLYTHKGLPPTPIANPGMAAIKAALQPATTDYYYYVLGKDGKHIFSKTYSEHQQVIAGLG
ncbi:MAG: endolytic transglycosylase MltG [Oscillospiraceae bacterium]|nr:endolytic transglycosylase MltG [Oscillospiraceae bacterium]MCI9586566.1 endolytic transglycosylase MltG [Oscillospiraceae bacterium]